MNGYPARSRSVRSGGGLGYTLVLREPWWNRHRMLVGSGTPSVSLHVFPATAPEPLRHLLFRDWLRSHADDRDLYAHEA